METINKQIKQQQLEKLIKEEREVRREREELMTLIVEQGVIPQYVVRKEIPYQLEKEILRQETPYQLEKELIKEQLKQEIMTTPYQLEKEILRQQVPYQLEKEILRKELPYQMEKELIQTPFQWEMLRKETPYTLEKELVKEQLIKEQLKGLKQEIKFEELKQQMPFGWTNNTTVPRRVVKEILRQELPYQLEKEINMTTPYQLEKEINMTTPYQLEKEILRQQVPYQLEKELVKEQLLNTIVVPTTCRGVKHCCETILETEVEEERMCHKLRKQIRVQHELKQLIVELVRKYHEGKIFKEELVQQVCHLEKELTKKWELQEECMFVENKMVEQECRPFNTIYMPVQHQIKREIEEQKHEIKHFIKKQQEEEKIRRELYKMKEQREFEFGRRHHEEKQLIKKIGQVERELLNKKFF